MLLMNTVFRRIENVQGLFIQLINYQNSVLERCCIFSLGKGIDQIRVEIAFYCTELRFVTIVVIFYAIITCLHILFYVRKISCGLYRHPSMTTVVFFDHLSPRAPILEWMTCTSSEKQKKKNISSEHRKKNKNIYSSPAAAAATAQNTQTLLFCCKRILL